jgi:putative ABC transport system permease protein
MLQDVLYVWHTLRKDPAFALTAILTLALGIGANTAVFSLVSGVLLRPLPYSDAARLVQLNSLDPESGLGPVAWFDLVDWRRHSVSFAGFTAYQNVSVDYQGGNHPERVAAVRAEPGLFDLLRVPPVAGRTFRADDTANVVVISHEFSGRLGGTVSSVGRQIVIDGAPYTVIGVMPGRFHFPCRDNSTEFWLPWKAPPPSVLNQYYRVDFVVARLRPEVSVERARAELNAMPRPFGRRAAVTPLLETVVAGVRPALLTLFGAVGAVLLIACANVMNLLLARGEGRRKEIAVRVALGAGRVRILRQLLTEGLMLSAAGGAAGLLLALYGCDWLLRLAAGRIPRAWEIGFDWRVFLFLLIAAVVSTIAFALAPALAASACDVQNGLKDAGNRAAGSSPLGRRMRNGLLIGEVAISFILLLSAGVLLRAFLRLQNTPSGFNPGHVLTAHLTVRLTGRESPGAFARYLAEVEERVARIPGVAAVGVTQFLPLQNSGWIGAFEIAGRPAPASQQPRAELRYVSPGYFAALGLPLRAGRGFEARDTAQAPRVILINETLALRYFPNQNPLGQQTDRGIIAGVVGDIRESGLDRPTAAQIYFPFAQNSGATPDAGVTLVVRARTSPAALAGSIRRAIHEINPTQVIFNVKTMDQVVSDSLADLNLYLWLVGLFALLALLLALTGTYGVFSYAVAGRTREFAVRMALGAGRRQISRLVIRQASVLVACALVIGLAGTLILTRTLRSLIASVTPPEPALLVLAALLLTATALAACAVPARRATEVDPNVALKAE